MFNTLIVQYMNAASVGFLLEPLIHYNMRASETGHALHVLKTLLYSKGRLARSQSFMIMLLSRSWIILNKKTAEQKT